MRIVRNGKLYDTETAERIGSDSFGLYGNFNHWEEVLYLKKTGEFFLYGYGGATSKYGEMIDTNSWSGGEKIIPLTESEAKAWVEKHLDGDKYIEAFGEVSE